MKAVEVAAFGGPDVLHVVERDPRVAGPGEVLIRVEAVGLNWSDVLQRAGSYPGGPTPPFVAGQEAAGVVVAHGEGVSRPAIGARVCAIGRGLAAEMAVVPALTCIEWEGSAEQRAALPIARLTSYAALAPYARRGKTVVIHAAAGALGHIAAQVARQFGARVIGTASASKRSVVVADVVCGYDELRDAAPDGVDMVLDGVGGKVFRDSLAVLRPGGTIVIVGASSGEPQQVDSTKLVMRSHSVVGLHLRNLLGDREGFARTVEGCRAMRVEARVTTMPMADIAQAHARLQGREVTGKLVLTW